MSDLISVIIPTKNAENTILRLLKSISEQKYTNLEILNIDYSDDKTPIIVGDYSKIDKRVKYIRSPVLGLAKQRNYGVKIAKGTFVVFVDGDDALTENFVSNLYNLLILKNADISCTNFLHIDGVTNKILDKTNSSNSYLLNPIQTCILLETSKQTQLTLCQGKLARKEFFEQHIVNEDILNEDEATTYNWYLNSNKICISECQDYLYFVNPNSLSSQHNKKLEIKIPQLCKAYEDRYHAYKQIKNKKLIFLGWKRLIDTSLQYAYVFKKFKNINLKLEMKKYYKKYRNISYLFIHFKTYIKLLLKYLRAC